jgi:hypothetical protein
MLQEKYKKAEGSYLEIAKLIKSDFNSYVTQELLQQEVCNDEVINQLQKDVGRTCLISIDEDYKDFERKCFDYKHQKGSFLQGSFTGKVFSKLSVDNLIIETRAIYQNYEYKNSSFIYQGDNKEGFGFSASFFCSSNHKILAFTFVSDFKQPDKDKSGVFIGIKDVANTQYIDNLKNEIQNNIKSNVIKDWLMLELFNSDGSFNLAGIDNVDVLFNSNRLNNLIIIERIKEINYARQSYFSRAVTAVFSLWGNGYQRSDDNSIQHEDSKTSQQSDDADLVLYTEPAATQQSYFSIAVTAVSSLWGNGYQRSDDNSIQHEDSKTSQQSDDTALVLYTGPAATQQSYFSRAVTAVSSLWGNGYQRSDNIIQMRPVQCLSREELRLKQAVTTPTQVVSEDSQSNNTQQITQGF